MQIRQLSDLDIPNLLTVEEAAQSSPWSEAAFRRCFEANYMGWTAEIPGRMLGFIMISINLGECHILNLCVHPAEQHKGTGTNLLLYAMRWAKQIGAGIVYLEVRRSNVAAISLYRKMNFKIIGERKDYYPMGYEREDALIFARDLGIEGMEIE
ncbi:MAG: ribosomal protein S18-alanine N-acetyltransferase [Pseudomonadota bacterium]